jgi:AAA domain
MPAVDPSPRAPTIQAPRREPKPERERRRVVAEYDYVDESGAPLFQAVRFEPKRFAQRRPDGNGGWTWNLDGVRRVLFRLPQVRAAVDAGDATVYVVEGEKDVVALERLGLVATTNAMGAGKWRDEDADALDGAREVVVIPDDDERGRAHAAAVARSLAGRVGTVKVVAVWPTGESGDDVSDWLAYAENDDEVEQAKRLLAEIVEQAPAFDPSTPPTEDASDRPAGADGLQAAARSQREPRVEFLSAEEFVAKEEPDADPLVVDRDRATAIAANGDVMVYGGGGAGKTTLFLDAAIHFAAGVRWLDGTLVPTRALNVGWIENEGPRNEFLRKLRRKLEAWGKPLAGTLRVLNRPWSAFDLRRDDHREALAAEIRERRLDLVVVGPLTAVGMEGGGTPDDVRAFVGLLAAVRALLDTAVTFLVIHHENRAGQVSGAWEPIPDLLVHVQGQGHGRLRVYWQKARWSSQLHATAIALRWADGESFEPEEPTQSTPERVWEEIEAFVLANGGCSWNDVEANVQGQSVYLRRRRGQMLDDGVLVNAGSDRSFELWHRDDPARPPPLPEVRPDVDTPRDTPVSDTVAEEGVPRPVSLVSPRRGDTGREDAPQPPPTENDNCVPDGDAPDPGSTPEKGEHR